jgi:hypothetical protein
MSHKSDADDFTHAVTDAVMSVYMLDLKTVEIETGKDFGFRSVLVRKLQQQRQVSYTEGGDGNRTLRHGQIVAFQITGIFDSHVL